MPAFSYRSSLRGTTRERGGGPSDGVRGGAGPRASGAQARHRGRAQRPEQDHAEETP